MSTAKRYLLAGNIVAILNAAADGGTVQSDVLERSGTDVPFTTLISWVTKGHKDRKNGAVSAHTKFADQWDALRAGAGANGPWMQDAMAEIDKALAMLREEAQEVNPAAKYLWDNDSEISRRMSKAIINLGAAS